MITFITGEEIANARQFIKKFTDRAIAAEDAGNHQLASSIWVVVGAVADLLRKDAKARERNAQDELAGRQQMAIDAASNGGF